MASGMLAGVKRDHISVATVDERQLYHVYPEHECSKRLRLHDSPPRENSRGTSLPNSTSNTPPKPIPEASFQPDASIVLIGIRGSGKSTLAIIASTAMKRRVVDLEKGFQDATGLSTVAYKRAHGPIEYRQRQYRVLETTLANHQRDCIIVSSWMEPGIHALLERYAASHPVIHIVRDPGAIQRYLKVADEGRIQALMNYTASEFRAVANFEFFNVSEKCSKLNDPVNGDSSDTTVRGDGLTSPAPYLALKRAERHFLKFLSLVMPPRTIPFIESAFPLASIPTETRQFTYAVSVPVSRILADDWETEDIETGADAIEIVIDNAFAPKTNGPANESQLSPECASLISRAIVKLTRPASTVEDNFEINTLRFSVLGAGQPRLPLIAYNTGAKGRHSACLNKILTSVLPDSMLESSVEKQDEFPYLTPSLTPRQATIALRSSFATDDALKLYVVGANCQHSLSPAMHNTAIHALGTSHVYKPYSTSSLSNIRDLIHDPLFGGASVGLPFKVEVISLTHSLSNHAKAIGAVNTLIPVRHLNPDGSIPDDALLSNARNCAGPVLALFGVQNIAVYNRSPDNAVKLVSHFELLLSRNDIPLLSKVEDGKTFFHVLRSRDDPWPKHLRQPTIVVSCIPSQQNGDQPPPNFTLPKAWMGSPTGGVVVDFSYKILDTPVILQTRAEAHRGWVVMDSLDLLPEQGFAQFELFTGRRAPRRLMRAEVVKSSPDEERSYPLQPRLDGITEQEP
ncbi:hypothetical protein NUW58_g4829 [Xylaria curta]|uniref:Uncharacterized protein n=1 Tax=Xylaria curta TaxID=42375 RepID=A0ACC1P5Y4_9PEZI|nr:hypothetical protein NUW58_g4829 [Xylaria curta]